MKKSELRQIIREEVQRLIAEKVEIVTTEFEVAHGKKPKGVGGWAFRLEDHPRGKDGEIVWPSQGKGSMRFQAAAKAAIKMANDDGKRVIIVMP